MKISIGKLYVYIWPKGFWYRYNWKGYWVGYSSPIFSERIGIDIPLFKLGKFRIKKLKHEKLGWKVK